jgi:hypothetical protein
MALPRRQASALPFSATLMVGAGLIALLIVALRRSGLRRTPSRLSSLCSAIVGANRQMIASALGPPRATAQHNNTWYYAVDPRRQLALVIEFVQGVARQAHLLRSPARIRQRMAHP